MEEEEGFGLIEVVIGPIALASYDQFIVPFQLLFHADELDARNFVETYLQLCSKINFVELATGILVPSCQFVEGLLAAAQNDLPEGRQEVLERLIAYAHHLLHEREEEESTDQETVETVIFGGTLQ